VSKFNTGRLPLRGILPVKKQTPHFRTYDLSQTLHGGRARRAHPKSWQPFFDRVHSFSARGRMLIFGHQVNFNIGFAASCR